MADVLEGVTFEKNPKVSEKKKSNQVVTPQNKVSEKRKADSTSVQPQRKKWRSLKENQESVYLPCLWIVTVSSMTWISDLSCFVSRFIKKDFWSLRNLLRRQCLRSKESVCFQHAFDVSMSLLSNKLYSVYCRNILGKRKLQKEKGLFPRNPQKSKSTEQERWSQKQLSLLSSFP